ncbi:MAG: hypothetical protein DRN66_02980 [Candidatus Nanohalarchaeota archaeon]|nr:MAG: hypothetical protein DRN66_02980 [Candidatus Nanohaloarchaeota archaeon]
MGELKKAMVETGIDKFLELVTIKKSISLKNASKFLSVPLDTLENWSNILSREKIISIDYDSFGNMVVFITQKNIEMKMNKVNSLKSTIEGNTKLVEANISVKEMDLKKEINYLEQFEDKLKKEMGYTKQLHEEFEKVASVEEDLIKKMAVMKKNKADLSKYIKGTTKEISIKIKTIERVEKEILKYEKIKEDIKTDIEFIKSLSRSIKKEPLQTIGKRIKKLENRQKKLLKENKKINSKYFFIHKLLNRFK